MTPTRSPWSWIPTLYFGQGLPYVVVMTLSVVMYKNLGLDNTAIALYTSWLYLPWVIKPLWSPLVDLLGTRRGWVVGLQFLVGAALAGVALTLPMDSFFQMSLAVFWLMAFASATHDIAADGFYMMALPQHQQAAFVGIRSLFYRASMIAGQGGLVYLAGHLAETTGQVVWAWQVVLGLLAVTFLLLFAWHRTVLPRPAEDQPQLGIGTVGEGLHRPGQDGLQSVTAQALWRGFVETFVTFFRRPDIVRVLAFLMLFRLGEAQLVKLLAPFLLDSRADGGIGLSTAQLGIAYGTFGVAALTLGGLLGGLTISRFGLKQCLWPMVAAIHTPNLLYVALALWQPESLALVTAAVAVEQLGYGFGFAAYLMFMIHVADGPHKTAHYALCTGFMALGMMLPGMVSGWLQQQMGYTAFFIWVCVATLPSVVAAAMVRIPPGFGRRQAPPDDHEAANPQPAAAAPADVSSPRKP
jgi:PAT family beta-lactamase induction signal transducer AmpG